MNSGNGYPQFLRIPFAQLKYLGCIVAWIFVMSGMVMVPVLFVLASPFLTASPPTSWLMPQVMHVHEQKREEVHPIPSTLLRETVHDNESQPSRVLPDSHSSPEPPQAFPHPPEEIHLLVDTSRHRLFVKQGEHVLHTAIVSTGKGTHLVDPRNPEKKWIFHTPKGRFRIQSKLEEPVWVRPDWAFIEQGDSVPENFADRLMPGVLGSYALGFGNGYFLHGALYLNLLGQDVTHGCIQLHPQDLQYIFETVPVGAPLIIT